MRSLVLVLLVHKLSVCWSEVPYHGMECDNGCDGNNTASGKYWCDTRRAGEGEDVWRCAELTR